MTTELEKLVVLPPTYVTMVCSPPLKARHRWGNSITDALVVMIEHDGSAMTGAMVQDRYSDEPPACIRLGELHSIQFVLRWDHEPTP